MGKRLEKMLRDEFKRIELGDKRLETRCQELAEDLAMDPGRSIPEACSEPAAIKGAYRFFANEAVGREDVLRPHYECTQERCRAAQQDIVMIQDTTYLSYAHHEEVDELGPIGHRPEAQGLLVHSALAVSVDNNETLGLMYQKVWVRQAAPMGESRWQRRHRHRESQCWTETLGAIRRAEMRRVIHIGDRGEDIYEVLQDLTDHQERFVIRGSWNRCLVDEPEHLFEAVRQTMPLGKLGVDLPARAGQKARGALLTIRACRLRVKAPRMMGRTIASLEVNVVEALEEHPPGGQKALHWRLLTSEAIDTLEACIGVVRLYNRRWKIEEFHKALKTGCQVEERRLETRHGLEIFLSIADVISTFLLRMRDVARDGSSSATPFLTISQVALLRYKFPHLKRNPSVQDALRAVAQLGGFMGRKRDGHPGWITLWRGMRRLIDMDLGFHMAKSILSPTTTATCG